MLATAVNHPASNHIIFIMVLRIIYIALSNTDFSKWYASLAFCMMPFSFDVVVVVAVSAWFEFKFPLNWCRKTEEIQQTDQTEFDCVAFKYVLSNSIHPQYAYKIEKAIVLFILLLFGCLGCHQHFYNGISVCLDFFLCTNSCSKFGKHLRYLPRC